MKRPSVGDPYLDHIAATALGRFTADPSRAFQRYIREVVEELEPREQIANLNGCVVREITTPEARSVILKYEWLGTMGRPIASFGLFTPSDELIGVSCFGNSTGTRSRYLCGESNFKKAICLERGACVHFAPRHAGSFLTTRACEMMIPKGYRVFYAYADVDAGEMGTIYSACNWLYCGQGPGRPNKRPRENWIRPDGSEVTSRTLRHRGMKSADARALGWVMVKRPAKHVFVNIVGDRRERRELRSALRYPVLPYPKREPKVEVVDTLDAGRFDPVLPLQNA